MTAAQFHSWLTDPARRPLVMGILNVTPDSFSDGGQFRDASAAAEHAKAMASSGASVIDIGGESSRPGAQPVAADEQVQRVLPVIRALGGQLPAVVSIDTCRAAVARAALEAGALIINDVFAGRGDPALLPLAAGLNVPVILMHMQGTSATMQANPAYANVAGEVAAFLHERIEAAVAAGVKRSNILIDPGIGFGKTTEHDLELLRRLMELKSLGRPIVVGVSRKKFIGRITGESLASGRPFGTAAATAWALANGADIVRVHDVGAMSQVVRMIEAIQKGTTDVPAA